MLSAPDITVYKPIRTGHESKFSAFLAFSGRPDLATGKTLDTSAYVIQVRHEPFTEPGSEHTPTHFFQLVTQVNFGPLLSKQYFGTAALVGGDKAFREINEDEVVGLNLKKLNAYKNFNIYQHDPHNSHHWRADVARPAGDIDL
jgi:hypothetical protein